MSANRTLLSGKTDLHVFHFQASFPLGGDLDAVFTPREIVDWVAQFGIFERFVLGNHPPIHFRVKTKLPPEEYLDAVTSCVEGLRPRFPGRIFKGIECDFVIKEAGRVAFNPPEKLLKRFDPEVPLIAFHFHNSLIYARLLDISISDLTTAFKAAICSGMFRILAHPFDALWRIYREDRRGFEEIANLAKERKVAFEINADKGFSDEVVVSLIKNGNLFSFGGDLHALSYWLKRDMDGIAVGRGDRDAVERLLGLTGEVADKEKLYWRELDPLFWTLEIPEGRGKLRDYAVRLYRDRRFHANPEAFEKGIKRVTSRFPAEKQSIVGSRLWDLYLTYKKWGGAPSRQERLRLERKYFLQVPLTAAETEIYEYWAARAFRLGLKEEQLINTWSTPQLDSLLN